MFSRFEESMDKYVLLIMDGIEHSTQVINFTENIQLEKIEFDKFEKYGLKFSMNEKCLEKIVKSIPEEFLMRNRVKTWEELSLEEIEDFVEDYLMYEGFFQLTKLVDAINICKKEPCSIYKQIFYNGFIDEDDMWEKPAKKYFREIQGCKIVEEDSEDIIKVWTRILEAYKSTPEINYKKYWWLIASEYFERYPNSEFIADQMIDLMIVLESLLSRETSELTLRFSLRSSLFLFQKYKLNPKIIQEFVKKMYNTRSKIVHGSTSLRSLKEENITVYENQIPLKYAINILRELMRLILFEAILNYSTISKKDFINYVDAILYEELDLSEIKPVDYVVNKYSMEDGVSICKKEIVELKDSK